VEVIQDQVKSVEYRYSKILEYSVVRLGASGGRGLCTADRRSKAYLRLLNCIERFSCHLKELGMICTFDV
jgi:hypothetical protein